MQFLVCRCLSRLTFRGGVWSKLGKGDKEVHGDHRHIGEGGTCLVGEASRERPDVRLVEDEVGGERALDTVRHHEPDLVPHLEMCDLTANLGYHSAPISAQDDGEVVCAHIGIVSVDEIS